jgi:hypothetical protein
VKNRVKRKSYKLKKIREMFWSGRPDLNRGPPAPKVNSTMLSSCLVYVFRASYITVYGGYSAAIVPKLFPSLGAKPLDKLPANCFCDALPDSAWRRLGALASISNDRHKCTIDQH